MRDLAKHISRNSLIRILQCKYTCCIQEDWYNRIWGSIKENSKQHSNVLVTNHIGFYSHYKDMGRYYKTKLEVKRGLRQRSSIFWHILEKSNFWLRQGWRQKVWLGTITGKKGQRLDHENSSGDRKRFLESSSVSNEETMGFFGCENWEKKKCQG